ncbi:MAG: MMPL family transporter [Acidimicrobiaceae bacterium]|nr:MMPL family transporter [Acidimicrobiaceae bacterium]
MIRVLDRFSRLVTARPYVTVGVLLCMTVFLGFGATLRAEPTEGTNIDFLPEDSDYTAAINELNQSFGDASDINLVTIVFRGDAFTPSGVAQMDQLLTEIVNNAQVAELLAPPNPLIAPSLLIAATDPTLELSNLTTEQIAGLRAVPELAAAFNALSGTDQNGTEIAIATVRLHNTTDERVAEAERTINQLAQTSSGTLEVSSVSPAVIQDEYKEATESGMAPLIGLALLLIAALILLFLRTLSDLLITLTGLVFSLTWIVGAEGWLGPNGLGWIGPPSSISAMVPIIVISLTVDYAIQTVSHYREQRAQGQAVRQAVRQSLTHVTLPLLLAAVTTIASFLSTLFSPISVVGDFGIVAGLGVGLSLIVMLTLVPAGRSIVDRRREAKGKLAPPRSVSSALPGVERGAQKLGAAVARRPAPSLIVVAGITVWLGFAATGLTSEFSIRDILPQNGKVLADMESLEASVGGSTELASVLVKAEATETRTLLNLRELEAAFADPNTRPGAAAGPLAPTYATLIEDWIEDNGEPNDKYDPLLAELFNEASADIALDSERMQDFLDRLATQEPMLNSLLVNNSAGQDAILLQFSTYSDDPAASTVLQQEIEELWAGDDEAITATSMSVLAVTITDLITSGQSQSISTTIAVALGVLILFYWVTLRRPVLGLVAVGPIVLVLIWVLGTMALLGIPYSLITSIITALSIGIGVDYTIHLIHRYQEEFTRVRNPEKAAVRTLATTGSALLGSALTTALGFGVLVFSPLEGSQHFGITAAITIWYSLVVAIFVVPPLMTVWGAYENMRLRSSVQSLWENLDVVIEDVHQKHQQDPPTD